MENLVDKVAVVTGAAGGLGLAIARSLAKAGTHVMVADIQEEKAKEAAAEIENMGVRAAFAACDVSDRGSVEKLADQAWATFGNVDLIFNNAGVMSAIGPLIEGKEEDFRWIWEVNVLGVWNGCSVFGKRFIEQGRPAHIVNTGSEHSIAPAHPMAGFYTVTKHAILALSDILRMELPELVQVSILCPGLIATDLNQAGKHRPDRFGGPTSIAPEGASNANLADLGMGADIVADLAVEGVRRGDFYIVTHPHDRHYVVARYSELLTAFDKQAPGFEGDYKYDMRKIMADLMS
jgi:NAD(P)-dependent dehydrogenase (short-subunit alcohol dehydrogenase family)